MRQIVLLRGVNLGARNRIAMPALREALSGAGFEGVATYVQSGNVVLTSALADEQLARECERLVEASFGFRVDAVVRTREELAAVVEGNPLGEVAFQPKRHQVTFLARALEASVLETLAGLALPSERFAAVGRELYAWHPDGVGRSRLATRLAGRALGVAATARNWSTVTALLEMASGSETGP